MSRFEGSRIVQVMYRATNTCLLLLIHSYSEGKTLQGLSVLVMTFILLFPLGSKNHTFFFFPQVSLRSAKDPYSKVSWPRVASLGFYLLLDLGLESPHNFPGDVLHIVVNIFSFLFCFVLFPIIPLI